MYIASMTFMYIASMEQATTSFLTPVIKGVILGRRKKAAFATLIVRKAAVSGSNRPPFKSWTASTNTQSRLIHRQSLYLTVDDDEEQ